MNMRSKSPAEALARRTGRLFPRARGVTAGGCPLQEYMKQQDKSNTWVGPGVAALIQSICLFTGGLLFRVVRRKGEHSF